MPADLAVLQADGDDGVGHGFLHLGVGIAGGDVELAALGVDRRLVPDPGAGGTVKLNPGGILAAGPGLQHRRLPQDLVGFQVDRRHLAGEGAAGIAGSAAHVLLRGGDRLVEDIARDHGRTGQHGQRMAVDIDLPQLCAGRSVQRPEVADMVAEIDHPAALRRAGSVFDHRRGAHGPHAALVPAHAAGPGVQGVEVTGEGAEEHPVADHGRLAGAAAGHGEGPLDLQPLDVPRRDGGGGLVARAGCGLSKAVPVGGRELDRRRLGQAHVVGRLQAGDQRRLVGGAGGGQGLAGDELGDLTHHGRCQAGRHRGHRAAGQCLDHLFGGALAQRRAVRRAIDRRIVASLALGFEQGRSAAARQGPMFILEEGQSPGRAERDGGRESRGQHRCPGLQSALPRVLRPSAAQGLSPFT